MKIGPFFLCRMFVPGDESRTHWFAPAAADLEGQEQEFELVGATLGLAIYNGIILDVHLPQAAYKKLLGQPAAGLEVRRWPAAAEAPRRLARSTHASARASS